MLRPAVKRVAYRLTTPLATHAGKTFGRPATFLAHHTFAVLWQISFAYMVKLLVR